MRSRLNYCVLIMSMTCLLACSRIASADLIPNGYKGVVHQLVFVDSEAFSTHRLVAAPVAGFGGAVEIKPNEPFDFSSKYGTRIYLVPADVEPLLDFDKARFNQWPSITPPVSEIGFVPQTSLITLILTKLRFAGVAATGPQIEVVDNIESGPMRAPLRRIQAWLTSGAVAAAGALILFVYWRRKRTKMALSTKTT